MKYYLLVLLAVVTSVFKFFMHIFQLYKLFSTLSLTQVPIFFLFILFTFYVEYLDEIMSFKNIGILNCLFGVKQIVDIVFNKNMIAKTLARRLLNQQSVFNFAKAAST